MFFTQTIFFFFFLSRVYLSIHNWDFVFFFTQIKNDQQNYFICNKQIIILYRRDRYIGSRSAINSRFYSFFLPRVVVVVVVVYPVYTPVDRIFIAKRKKNMSTSTYKTLEDRNEVIKKRRKFTLFIRRKFFGRILLFSFFFFLLSGIWIVPYTLTSLFNPSNLSGYTSKILLRR